SELGLPGASSRLHTVERRASRPASIDVHDLHCARRTVPAVLGPRSAVCSPTSALPYPTPTAVSTCTLRRNSAAASCRTVLMNIPDPSSKPATRVKRGITLRYQWKYFTPTHSAGALRTV